MTPGMMRRSPSAIGKAGNVVLFAYTKKEISTPAGNTAGELIVQRLIPPIAPIAQSALALAPFPLPVFPVKVSQFWTFTPATGDLPTLPLVALQLHAATAYPDLLELINQHTRAGNNRSPKPRVTCLPDAKQSFPCRRCGAFSGKNRRWRGA